MPAITVMLKPASGLCNMRCRYCFYADEQKNRSVPSYGLMSEEVLRAVLTRVLEYADGECTIAFQGGEPTCAGLPFFRRVVELEQKLNHKEVAIHNAIQTNGYVIDDEWAQFLADNHFLVGVSLDGPREIHDLNRLDAKGNGTYNRVMRAIATLKKHGAEFNILTVVTSATCRSIRKTYSFFQRNGLDYQQYIPCLDPLGEERGGHDYSLTCEAFGQYLKDLFDCWYEDARKGRLTYNRYFTNLLLILTRQQPEACGMLGQCGRQYVVEADGSVYPCDFYMLDEWKLGNFLTDTVEDVDRRRDALGFIQMSIDVNQTCQKCKWFPLCRGGCRRDREPMVDGKLQKNYFCEAYSQFFEYAYPRLAQVARAVEAGVFGSSC